MSQVENRGGHLERERIEWNKKGARGLIEEERREMGRGRGDREGGKRSRVVRGRKEERESRRKEEMSREGEHWEGA